MTLRLSAAVAVVCLLVLPGPAVVVEEPGEAHSDHVAEAHHRHLVSGFVGATHEHGENDTVGRIGIGYDFEFGRSVLAPEVNLDFLDREEAVVYGVAIGRKF